MLLSEQLDTQLLFPEDTLSLGWQSGKWYWNTDRQILTWERAWLSVLLALWCGWVRLRGLLGFSSSRKVFSKLFLTVWIWYKSPKESAVSAQVQDKSGREKQTSKRAQVSCSCPRGTRSLPCLWPMTQGLHFDAYLPCTLGITEIPRTSMAIWTFRVRHWSGQDSLHPPWEEQAFVVVNCGIE